MVRKSETLPVTTDGDLVLIRRKARDYAVECGFSSVDQTRLMTAGSELARNMVLYAGGGVVEIAVLFEGGRTGVRLVFVDSGPGIADLDQAMRDGYTTGGGLGLGLGGARRLVDEFEIRTAPGLGTTVSITRWR